MISRDGLKAHLVADGGAGAVEEGEFFRSADFLTAEGVTDTLSIQGRGTEISLPVIVRGIEATEYRDAISPYGYPGGTLRSGPPPDPGEVDWSSTDLVSVFVRDRLGAQPAFGGGTERSVVHIADPVRGQSIHSDMRTQVNRNRRRGWKVTTVHGPVAGSDAISRFAIAYGDSMDRNKATENYRHPIKYFQTLLRAESSWLLIASCPGEPGWAGAIAVRSDGFLHYYLGGTTHDGLRRSPMKTVSAEMISMARDLGLKLSFGGGFSGGDTLGEFKRRFANDAASFRTHEIICDQEAYAALAADADVDTSFFPAYRAE
jgi:hypothetical protein